ncbi:MAG: hypothetical protein JKY61_08655 [Planctomycetes bacterium]|nr:hypothetical protein [Planctomycetota bacterium]
MNRYCQHLLVLAAFCVPTVAAQTPVGFNVAIQHPNQSAVPSASYSAGSTQAGVWNRMATANGQYSGTWSSGLLDDINGNPTSAEILVSGSYGAYGTDWANTSGDDALLLDNGLEIRSYYYSAHFEIRGLEAGRYTLYTYGLASVASNDVMVTGAGTKSTVFGDFSNGFVEGVTHTVHRIRVFQGGTIFVTAVPHVYGLYGQVDGFQIVPDGGSVGVNYCDSTPNSTGAMASMTFSGTASVQANNLGLGVIDLPTNQFGYFIVSQDQGIGITPPGSQGILCVGGNVGRHNRLGEVLNSGLTGSIALAIDLGNVPQPTGPISVMSGETWNWQFWYRDNNPGSTSNFSDGNRITFSN